MCWYMHFLFCESRRITNSQSIYPPTIVSLNSTSDNLQRVAGRLSVLNAVISLFGEGQKLPDDAASRGGAWTVERASHHHNKSVIDTIISLPSPLLFSPKKPPTKRSLTKSHLKLQIFGLLFLTAFIDRQR